VVAVVWRQYTVCVCDYFTILVPILIQNAMATKSVSLSVTASPSRMKYELVDTAAMMSAGKVTSDSSAGRHGIINQVVSLHLPANTVADYLSGTTSLCFFCGLLAVCACIVS
jgi:hypothetical protein